MGTFFLGHFVCLSKEKPPVIFAMTPVKLK